jgi:hypothetical protein
MGQEISGSTDVFANCTLRTTPDFLQIVGVGGHLKVDFTARFGFVIVSQQATHL